MNVDGIALTILEKYNIEIVCRYEMFCSVFLEEKSKKEKG